MHNVSGHEVTYTNIFKKVKTYRIKDLTIKQTTNCNKLYENKKSKLSINR